MSTVPVSVIEVEQVLNSYIVTSGMLLKLQTSTESDVLATGEMVKQTKKKWYSTYILQNTRILCHGILEFQF